MVAEQPESGPLTDEHLELLNTAIGASEAVRSTIARAKAAGFEVDDQEQQLDALEQQARSIKQAFFPGQ